MLLKSCKLVRLLWSGTHELRNVGSNTYLHFHTDPRRCSLTVITLVLRRTEALQVPGMRGNGTFSFLQVKRNRSTGVTEEQNNEIIGCRADHGDRSARAVHDGCRRRLNACPIGINLTQSPSVRRGEGGDAAWGGHVLDKSALYWSPTVPVCDIHPSYRQHDRATRATIKAHSTHPNHPRPYGSSKPISLA